MAEERVGPVAFIDPDGSFWAPTPSSSMVAAGGAWVPAEDYTALCGLLEAALRRERALEARVAALAPPVQGGTWDEAVRAGAQPT